MNLPTEFSSGSVGKGDGVSWGGIAVLDFPPEWMRFCPVCQRETHFIAQIELVNGLFGICANCGDERVVPYTRTVSEESF